MTTWEQWEALLVVTNRQKTASALLSFTVSLSVRSTTLMSRFTIAALRVPFSAAAGSCSQRTLPAQQQTADTHS